MEKIKLEIVGLSYSQTQTGAYALVLGEELGKRRLPIIIGGFEAQAIAIELEKMQPSRPLTHDLFKTFAENFEIAVKEVIIYNLVEGIFYAKLVCNNGVKEVEIDTRTSDAIALAVRFNCPIYTYEFILANSGIVLEDDIVPEEFEEDLEIKDIAKSVDSFNGRSIQDLEKDLKDAIVMEDYEKASRIRDEIDQRKTA
tara:strand:- start:130 stop:723 length:594 start_codon:yes stop_codon:yes gene_type:complete